MAAASWSSASLPDRGSWVDIDDDGVVTVNGKELKEPYLEQRSFGKCDIELPCQVPDDSYFVMGRPSRDVG